MNQLSNCPCCGGSRFAPYLSCKDYTVSGESFSIVNCSDCNFKFTNPRPSDTVIGNYYKSDDYISHSDTKKGIVAKLYHVVRSYTLKQKENLLLKHVSRGTLLDYGCGTGMFLKHCKSTGWSVEGIEPDSHARAMAAAGDFKVYGDPFSIDLSKKYDAITLWHVLEHVGEIERTIAFLKERLNPSGVLIVAVPNYNSFDARFYKEHWAAYDLPRHFYHFDENSLQRIMKKGGFSLVRSIPMKFDSFYVSLLSEKYLSGKARLLKAFWIGLKSNLVAKSASEYSSVIYVLKPLQ
jgi:SAM-dependent methyltransferase